MVHENNGICTTSICSTAFHSYTEQMNSWAQLQSEEGWFTIAQLLCSPLSTVSLILHGLFNPFLTASSEHTTKNLLISLYSETMGFTDKKLGAHRFKGRKQPQLAGDSACSDTHWHASCCFVFLFHEQNWQKIGKFLCSGCRLWHCTGPAFLPAALLVSISLPAMGHSLALTYWSTNTYQSNRH